MASREIFIDTSGLYALVSGKDSHHAAARTVVERLIRAGRRFVASDYIVAESVNLANGRGGAPVAVHHAYSFTDCSRFVLMQRPASTSYCPRSTEFWRRAFPRSHGRQPIGLEFGPSLLLGLFCYNLSTLRDVDRRTVHSRSLAGRFGGKSECTPYSSGEALWPFDTLGRFHACCSNNTGEAPELSYIAHDSAIAG